MVASDPNDVAKLIIQESRPLDLVGGDGVAETWSVTLNITANLGGGDTATLTTFALCSN
jgi:hypothetical protein